jgi:hypothetical protein
MTPHVGVSEPSSFSCLNNARFHPRFFRVPSLCGAIPSLIFRKDPSKAVECQGNEQDGEQRFHLCVNVPHPLLIQMQKWRSRTKFSRGKPLPFYKSELKIHRFLGHLKWCIRPCVYKRHKTPRLA